MLSQSENSLFLIVQWCLLNNFSHCGAGSNLIIVWRRTQVLSQLHIFTQRFVAVALSLFVTSISITMAFYYAWLVAALWGFMLGVLIKKEMNTICIVPLPKNGRMYTGLTIAVCPSVWKLFLQLLNYLLSLDIQWWYFIHVLGLLLMVWWRLPLILGSKFKVKTVLCTLHQYAPPFYYLDKR